MPNEWVLTKTDYIDRILRGGPKVHLHAALYAIKNACSAWETTTYLVGANPAFDDRFLRKAFKNIDNGEVPYHYHLIDVETLVMGKLGLVEPPKLKECRGLLGILGSNPAPHAGLSDAKEAKLIFDYLNKIDEHGKLIAGLTSAADEAIF